MRGGWLYFSIAVVTAIASAVAAPGAAAEELALPTSVVHAVSRGATNRGRIIDGATLAPVGVAHFIPEPWRARGTNHGTDELVGAIERASLAVRAIRPGAILGVGDLSKPGGGRLTGHRSHQSGRDADLHYYALDASGAALPPDGHFPVYTSTGKATYARAPEWNRNIVERYFDLGSNWVLVRALLTDPHAKVERIFVSWRIEKWLLAYAETIGEDAQVIEAARTALHQPSDSDAHDDHMHVRIACCDTDRALGRCRD